MAIPKFKPLANTSQGTKNLLKPILVGIIGILLVAFGLESTNNDFDLGKLFGGSSIEESKVLRDESGNVMFFDKNGDVTSDSTKGKKASDYNCDDFSKKSEAQSFFIKVGGKGNDLYRLDGDKDGEACESLPIGDN